VIEWPQVKKSNWRYRPTPAIEPHENRTFRIQLERLSLSEAVLRMTASEGVQPHWGTVATPGGQALLDQR
jgi:hypothetical protein